MKSVIIGFIIIIAVFFGSLYYASENNEDLRIACEGRGGIMVYTRHNDWCIDREVMK